MTNTTGAEPFGYCLNTATIREQKVGIVREIEIAAEAGYGAIEPWIESIREYEAAGGSVDDLARRIADSGLRVPGAIGFAEWLADDAAARAAALEEARSDMELVLRIGGTGIAAPPAGMTEAAGLDPFVIAERYRALIDVGEQVGIVPQLELWGFSQVLCRLGEVTLAAIEAGHPNACILLDVYHIYKGGSDFAGLRLLGPRAVPIVHMNDYPAEPPRSEITDADRVYPGDGIAPLDEILGCMIDGGWPCWLSLELFNKAYYAQPAIDVAKTGLAKMKAAVAKAAAGRGA